MATYTSQVAAPQPDPTNALPTCQAPHEIGEMHETSHSTNQSTPEGVTDTASQDVVPPTTIQNISNTSFQISAAATVQAGSIEQKPSLAL